MNLNNRRFVTTGNEKGLSSNDTVFHYFQKGNLITGHYKGGAIAEGAVVGKQIDDSNIKLLFQCVTTEGQLKAGESLGIISKNTEGKLTLSFEWKWLNGDLSGGQSSYIEID